MVIGRLWLSNALILAWKSTPGTDPAITIGDFLANNEEYSRDDGARSKSGRDMSIGNRMKAPVFVLGCPRSGTTLLYDMLISSGQFANYRVETSVFNRVTHPFGNLKLPGNRTRLMDAWLQSDYFERSGLEAEEIRAKVLVKCRNAGDFLRIVMEKHSAQAGRGEVGGENA
jgi:hypothetical protein